jgi:hypothetical protein
LEFQDPRVRLVLLEFQDPRVRLAHLEFRVKKESMVRPAHLEKEVPLVHLETKVHLVRPAHLETRD